MESTARRTFWTGWALSALVIVFLLFDGVTKVLGVAPVVEACARLGWSAHAVRGVGTVLLVCTALYAIPQTTVLGTILLTAFLGGAVATHVRAGSGAFETAFAAAFAGVTWLGAVLREPRLLPVILRR